MGGLGGIFYGHIDDEIIDSPTTDIAVQIQQYADVALSDSDGYGALSDVHCDGHQAAWNIDCCYAQFGAAIAPPTVDIAIT